MADAYETGAIFTTAVPSWQRTWYEQELLDTIRMKSILVTYTVVKEDFNAVKTKTIVYSEVYDAEPNWNSTSESTIWFKGGSLDSRTISITVNLHHDIMKFSDYHSLWDYIQNGQIPAIIREKLGQSLVDTMDILARNAFLTHPDPTYAGIATSRATLGATDLFDVELAESTRTHLEEADVPGVVSTEDGGGQTILCITTPRVIHDIRTSTFSTWLDAQNYNQTGKKFTSEVGTWNGIRFIKTNRLVLRNMGETLNQTTLNGDTVEGQGAAATVDTIYSPGQSGCTRTVTVASSSGFTVGDVVTIHASGLGTTILETDGTQETRRIVSKPSGTTVSFDKPLLKAHTSGDYMTLGRNVHASLFVAGPSIVQAIAERPHFYIPPKIDDAMMINRIGWRGVLKFQLFRPEYYKLHYSAGSTD